MKKQISTYLILIKLYILSITGKIINSKYDPYSINNKNVYSIIRYFSSNHPRRMQLIKNSLLNKIQLIKKSSAEDRADLNFIAHKNKISINKKTLLVYVGDSMIEHLSRVRLNDFSYKNSLAFWIGAKTRLGLNSEKEMNSLNLLIKKYFDRNLSKMDYEETILIWSSGSIDVRCSIYELELRGLIGTEQNLIQYYEDTTKNLINNLILPLGETFNTKKIVMLSELDSSLDSQTPETLKDLKKIKEKDPYPTLGNFSYRSKWRKKLNSVSRDQAELHGIKFFDLNPYIFDEETGLSNQFDKVHISNPITIDKINKNIIDSF